MDREPKNFRENDTSLVGAIFMSNRKTKLECLQRHLFGLPAQMAGFLKKVKAGMLLFLFEHEERKLYGVFEATSNGAMNIIPNAFVSSGKHFPAQILFRRIWMCKPLSEDEFRDAIKENYYHPHKFNFGLSYDQVYKLIYLFSLKRISLQQHQKPGIPNMVIQDFEKSCFGKVTVAGKGLLRNSNSDESDTCDATNSGKHLHGVSRVNENELMHSKRSGATLESSEVAKPGFSSAVPHPPIPNLISSASQIDLIHTRDFYFSPSHGIRDNMVTGPRKLSSVSLPWEYPSQEPTAFTPSTLEPWSRSKLHMSQSGFSDLPSSNHLTLDVSRSHQICQGSSVPVEISSVTLPHAATENTTFPDRCSPRYSPLSPLSAAAVNKGTYYSPSVHSPSHGHDYPEASQQEDACKRRQSREEKAEPSNGQCSQQNDELDMQYSYSLESEEENEYKEPKLNNNADGDEHSSIFGRSKLRADTDQMRSSVFSRLSRSKENHEKYNESFKEPSLSLEQLIEMLSQKRDQWNMNMELEPKLSDVQVENKQMMEVTMDVEQIASAFISEHESSNVAGIEGNIEFPFFNFKRRSEVQKCEHVSETSGHLEDGEGEKYSTKYKKRRLVRPSFGEEECKNADDPSIENAQAETSAENEVKIAGDEVSSVRSHEDSVHTNGYFEASTDIDKPVNNIESARYRGSELSNGNSRWHLLKSILDQARPAAADPNSQEHKANTVSHSVDRDEASLLRDNVIRQGPENGGVDMVMAAPTPDNENIGTIDFLPLGA